MIWILRWFAMCVLVAAFTLWAFHYTACEAGWTLDPWPMCAVGGVV